jgi:hypothetical protein
VREICSPGSVRGALRKEGPYRSGPPRVYTKLVLRLALTLAVILVLDSHA